MVFGIIALLIIFIVAVVVILKKNTKKKSCDCGYNYTPDDIVDYGNLQATGKEIMGEQAFYATLKAVCPKCKKEKTFRCIVSYYPNKETPEDGIRRYLNK